MDKNRFWQLIEQARQPTGRGPKDPSAEPDNLRSVLQGLAESEVKEFVLEFNELLCDLNSWKLWGAGYVINGGMGDDSFNYFRSWIIGKGRAAFEAANDPDNLGRFIDDDEEVDNELLEYVALDELESRGITDDPRDLSERNPDDDPSGEPFDEDTVERDFPKLAGRFA